MTRIINLLLTTLKRYGIFALMIVAALLSGSSGWIVFIALNILFGGYMLWRNWGLYKNALTQIEILLWGKPKESMIKGERRPKIILCWSKKNAIKRDTKR